MMGQEDLQKQKPMSRENATISEKNPSKWFYFCVFQTSWEKGKEET